MALAAARRARLRPGGLRELYRRGDAVDYYEGEEPPRF
jgi:hypothetical protein